MTDVLIPPPPAPSAPNPPGAPLTPPPPTGDASPQPPERRPSRWRFGAGLLTGVVAAALGVGGYALVHDSSGDTTPADASPTPAATAPPSAGSSGGSGTATASSGELVSVHDLVVAARPSIVAIHTTLTETDVFGQQVQGQAAGSGFVLSADGYVVTNAHVVDGADAIRVSFDDTTTEDATLVAADPRSDLAVLHVDRTDLTPMPIGDSDAIQVGDPVVAIGNALDLGAEPTVTSGLVSAKDRTITEPNGQILTHLIQTDAAISPGNSGGPLLDGQGRVVGINTAIAGNGENIGLAISINHAEQLIQQLQNGQVPQHALLGVSTAPADNGSGATVVQVAANSGAADGGIEVGDTITKLDDVPITSPEDLVVAIADHSPGDRVTVTVTRNGSSQTLDVVLGAHTDGS